jgi:CRISPR-associated protein Cmr5
MTTAPQESNRPTPTLDQRRAAHAWRAADRLRVGSPEADDYAREAKKLPVRIITAGLGQALSFLAAKAKDRKKGLADLHADLTEWTKQRLPRASGHATLLEAVVQTDSQFLRRATDELLAYLGWLNRFVEAKGLPSKKEVD